MSESCEKIPVIKDEAIEKIQQATLDFEYAFADFEIWRTELGPQSNNIEELHKIIMRIIEFSRVANLLIRTLQVEELYH